MDLFVYYQIVQSEHAATPTTALQTKSCDSASNNVNDVCAMGVDPWVDWETCSHFF